MDILAQQHEAYSHSDPHLRLAENHLLTPIQLPPPRPSSCLHSSTRRKPPFLLTGPFPSLIALTNCIHFVLPKANDLSFLKFFFLHLLLKPPSTILEKSEIVSYESGFKDWAEAPLETEGSAIQFC